MQSRFFESIILSGTGLSVGVINEAIRPFYSKKMQGMAVSEMFTDTGSFMNPEIHKKYILRYLDLDLANNYSSVEQGFQKPQGYEGKGLEGRGQGRDILTPHKPLPLSEGKGIPSLLLMGKSSDDCGCLPHHMLSTNKAFCSQQPLSSQPPLLHYHHHQPPPCHFANGDVATNNGQKIMNDRQETKDDKGRMMDNGWRMTDNR